MEEMMSFGAMPEKVEAMELSLIYREIARRFIEKTVNIIEKTYPNGSYPISQFDTQDLNGVQIVLESDQFSTDLICLRKTFNGYIVTTQSKGAEDYGMFTYEFEDEDPLVEIIPNSIRTELSDALG